MAQKFDIILYALAGMVGIFVFSKIIAVIFRQLYESFTSPEKKHNSAQDLDRMIERQKQMLRASGLGTSHTGNTNSKISGGQISSTEEAYKSAIEKGGIGGRTPEQLKTVLELIDQLQWGTGKNSQRISDKYKSITGFPLDLGEIQLLLKEQVAHSYWLKYSPHELLALEDIERIIVTRALLDEVASARDGQIDGSKWMTMLRRQNPDFRSLRDSSLSKSMDHLFEVLKGADEGKLFAPGPSYKGKAKQELIRQYPMWMNGGKKSSFHQWSGEKILLKMAEWCQALDSISPLSPLSGKDDWQGALRIFNLPEKLLIGENGKFTQDANKIKVALESIKKTYKELASKRHPDKFSAKGLSGEAQKTIEENFMLIQQAYDILKEKCQS